MATGNAIVLLDEWNDAARRFSLTENAVMVLALDLLKCMIDKDVEEIDSATEALKRIMKRVAPSATRYKNAFGHRNLMYGIMESLHITVRAMIDKGRLDGCNKRQNEGSGEFENGPSFAEVKEEIEDDWEQVENVHAHASCSVETGLDAAGSVADGKRDIKEEDSEETISAELEHAFPSESEVKMEEVIVKEEPLCPPIIDSIRIPMSTTPHHHPYVRKLPAGFRKATKQDFAKVSMSPTVSSSSQPSTSKEMSTAEPASYFSSLNAEYAQNESKLFGGSRKCTWQCKECKQFFVNDKFLGAMREAHQKFECHDCLWKFCTTDELNRHRKTFECGKHACAYCTHRFPNLKMRDVHTKNVHGEMPYPCVLCGQKFNTSQQFELHKFTKHSVKPSTTTKSSIKDAQKK